jgi:hypothetical protein
MQTDPFIIAGGFVLVSGDESSIACRKPPRGPSSSRPSPHGQPSMRPTRLIIPDLANAPMVTAKGAGGRESYSQTAARGSTAAARRTDTLLLTAVEMIRKGYLSTVLPIPSTVQDVVDDSRTAVLRRGGNP